MCTNRYNFVSLCFFRHIYFCGEVKGQNIQSFNALDFEMFTLLEVEKYIVTRLHSSRMRTTRVMTVSSSMLCAGGGVPGPEGVCSRGGCLLRGGVSAPGGVPAPGGGACSGGGLLPGGWYPSMH